MVLDLAGTPVILYMTGKPGDGSTSGHSPLSEDKIAENMTLDEINEHGDPSDWIFVKHKSGSGAPANTPTAPEGTLKMYERWTDAFGNLLEVHYFKHLDGTFSNIVLYPPT